MLGRSIYNYSCVNYSIAVKTKAIFTGFVIVPAKLTAIVQQPVKIRRKEKCSLLIILLGMIC